MFDIGWTEMIMVAIVTILVVGPRELPGMLRTFGTMMKKAKGMVGDLQSQFDQALKQSELDELKQIMNDPVSIEPPKNQTPEEIEAEIKQNYEKAKEVACANKTQSGTNAVPGFTSEPIPEESEIEK